MLNKAILESVDTTFQDILDCELPFGGLTVVLGGDFRQTLPIIRKGSRTQIVSSSFMRSHLWLKFQVVHFTENMRVRNAAQPNMDSQAFC